MAAGETEQTKKHTLIVKNLPKYVENIEVLIQSPNAEIQTFGRRRALLHFKDAEAAERALKELEERGLTIAKFTTEKEEGKNAWTTKSNKATQTAKLKANCNQSLDLNINFERPPPPHLKYAYPRITPSILENISAALLSNTRFYTQVLHLMNRMNLEPPFEARQRKSLPLGFKEIGTQTESKAVEYTAQIVDEMPSASELESELESSEDDHLKEKPLKRRKLNRLDGSVFKEKARKLLMQTQKVKVARQQHQHKHAMPINEAFEDAAKRKSTKIALNVTASSLASLKAKPISNLQLPADLSTQQMPFSQLQALPIYKNYNVGTPSNKLYIKNLAKQTTDADLLMLYQRFVDLEHLDVKVMQQGRMRGQAFVTFINLSDVDTQQIVAKALQQTHGFILYDKPMIVSYGRQS